MLVVLVRYVANWHMFIYFYIYGRKRVFNRMFGQWYQNRKLVTYIATYTDQRHMEREVREAGRYGWIPQGMASTAGHRSAGKMIVGAALTVPIGGIGALWGAKRSKDKMTVTFIRTPGWLAQNR
jgi:hypothetical protein